MGVLPTGKRGDSTASLKISKGRTEYTPKRASMPLSAACDDTEDEDEVSRPLAGLEGAKAWSVLGKE